MKKYITTIVLVGVFVGLLAFFYFYEADKEDKTDEESNLAKTFTIWDINKEEIKELNIKYEGKEFEIKREEDGTWKIIKPKEGKADTEKINSILDEYKSIEGKGEEIQTESLEEFGLEKPKGEAKFKFKDESEKKIIFGNSSIDEVNIYAKTSDSDIVFLTDKFLFDRIKVTEKDLKEKEESEEDKEE